MGEGSDHIQPSGNSREQILRDLEAAGLLRLLDTKSGLRRASARPLADVLPPQTNKILPRRQTRKRWLALLVFGLCIAMLGLIYLALVVADGGTWLRSL